MSVYAEEERIVYDGIAEEKKDVLGSTSSKKNQSIRSKQVSSI
jgi:hypothetical protein